MADSVPIIDHVGIAVNSVEHALPLYEALLGGPPAGVEVIASESVRVAFFGVGAGRVELLEPLDPESPIARFLDRRGPGLHHVCLQVTDLEEALERAIRTGATVIPPGVRIGAGARRVAFLHPGSAGGVLLELTEADSGE
jgi:methylmalonyl-CoA/ethylmalonyl-CoA epimerase